MTRTRVRDNRIIFYANDELKDKLDKEAKEKMIKRSSLINKILEDLYKGKTEYKYEFLNDSCLALAFEDNTFICVWGRIGKTPDIKKLGNTETITGKICKSCKETIDIIKIEEKNKELKKQLSSPLLVRIPQCGKGGKINEAVNKIWCPDIGKERPIMKREKKSDYIPCKLAGINNSQCKWLSIKTLKIKNKYQTEKNM